MVGHGPRAYYFRAHSFCLILDHLFVQPQNLAWWTCCAPILREVKIAFSFALFFVSLPVHLWMRLIPPWLLFASKNISSLLTWTLSLSSPWHRRKRQEFSVTWALLKQKVKGFFHCWGERVESTGTLGGRVISRMCEARWFISAFASVFLYDLAICVC